MRCFLVSLYSIGWTSGFLFIKFIPASTCKRKSYPNPVLLSSYQEKASFKSCSASGLTMTLYFIVCPQFFYTHPPTESLIQGFGDTSPIVHQLFFSPLRLVQQKLLLQLLYPKYPLPIEFFLISIIQEHPLQLFFHSYFSFHIFI